MSVSIPYGRHDVDQADIDAVVEVLRSDWLTQGPAVERFEAALAEYCGARHAVVCSSGTAALHLACLAAGVGPGDEVVTSPNTFVASANCVSYAGGTVLLADIDPESLNIDPEALAATITEKTTGIVPVHFAGHPCDIAAIAALARRRGLFVIEDAAHALGARYRDSRIGSCAYSDMTVFSFHPVKSITTGDGGAVLTNHDELSERLRSLRNHGIVRDADLFVGPEAERAGSWYYEMQRLGFNYRLTDIQCALGESQLGKLDGFVAERRRLARRYRDLLAPLSTRVVLPNEASDVRSAWHIFPIRLNDASRRRAVFEAMRAAGIGVQVHYVPVHLHPYHAGRSRYRRGDLPNAEAYYDAAMTLPLYPALADEDQERVAQVLTEALADGQSAGGA